MHRLLDRIWYHRLHPLAIVLWPLSQLFGLIVILRRQYLRGFRQQQHALPVIVVGNLTVGGTGKTPLIIALAQALIARGYRPGIISRGYRAGVTTFPHFVQPEESATQVGDEPLLIRRRVNAPLVIDPCRNRAVEALIQQGQCDIILSDDGLQHYALGRQMEIAVIDGQRGLGNGWLLPAGPLREGPDRLKTVDLIVANQGQWPGAFPMTLQILACRSLAGDASLPLEQLTHPITAIAGIGNPQRFFKLLSGLGLDFLPVAFADHYPFSAHDLDYKKGSVLMTEKDAVKCRDFAADNLYYLPIEAQLPPAFWQAFWSHSIFAGQVRSR